MLATISLCRTSSFFLFSSNNKINRFVSTNYYYIYIYISFVKLGEGNLFIFIIMFYYSFNKKRINFVDRFVYSYIVARLLHEKFLMYIVVYIDFYEIFIGCFIFR